MEKEHHKTRYSRLKAERYFQTYCLMGPGERTLHNLMVELRREGEKVSRTTLERYSKQYRWPERLHEQAVQDQTAGRRKAEEIRARRRHYHYVKEQTGEEWAVEELSIRIHQLCAQCCSDLQVPSGRISFCPGCSRELRPILRALTDSVPYPADLKRMFEIELWRERAADLEFNGPPAILSGDA
ncbi:hypothetical protein [Deinococcus apachensis]|uniref:hypothetical protein n=1 Tax=Deinococcus apachensis TaxID=309886 RepID=UPI0003684CCD|nr:hypothetical protein [Deinococcus apachensis]